MATVRFDKETICYIQGHSCRRCLSSSHIQALVPEGTQQPLCLRMAYGRWLALLQIVDGGQGNQVTSLVVSIY